MKDIVIKDVLKDSLAYKTGLRAGDILLSINDSKIKDILDYKYLISDEYLEIEIRRDNEEYICTIEKEFSEDIGLVFDNELIDGPRRCANNCIFCFMDQLPNKSRDTLVFKDDDYRLSFLTGNYVSMTNMVESDIDRIIYYHLSPINISVHSTDIDVRKKMLNNRNADKVLGFIQKLYDNNIHMNAQIVLCREINDGKILEKTITDLSKYYPYMQSISIVPVGLTKYREGLYDLIPFDKESTREVVKEVSKYQREFKEKYGSSIVYLGDEFYLQSGEEMPDYSHYEDFPQLENGVGMVALFEHDFIDEINKLDSKELSLQKNVSIATGALVYEYICSVAKRLEAKVEGLNINVFKIKNEYFGERITVTGLITGSDLVSNLKDKELGDKLYICSSMLKDDEDVFLDDMSLDNVKKELNVEIEAVDNSASEFIEKIIY